MIEEFIYIFLVGILPGYIFTYIFFEKSGPIEKAVLSVSISFSIALVIFLYLNLLFKIAVDLYATVMVSSVITIILLLILLKKKKVIL